MEMLTSTAPSSSPKAAVCVFQPKNRVPAKATAAPSHSAVAM